MGLYRRHEDYIAVRAWETRMAALLRLVADRLTDDQLRWGMEFLAHAEYGLAIESVADWLAEEDRSLTAAERAEMTALAGELGADVHARVERSLGHCL
ncbi:MafI family immunity protein [Actinomadura opuntiae]|uniref:MafI family immunity protein n=1 Tax=Actinomadura sp. OS1-43 TaxID=604315 RepID=UPI00255AC958|nr:MafI family immunity protein [Actinomadura sp. OS1-43]MDL4819304.1 MafI family immunity protein [Actinomadura sp. OS1-43]